MYQHVTFIPQNPSFFRRTIWENLTYGCRNVSLSAVDQACTAAGILDVIQALPDGYHTEFLDQGTPFSGGEKQRLSIAKAFLRNTPILIFDEVTSQLDALSEDFIQNALYRLMEHKTCIVIAHRLRTIASMDQLLIFDHGKIVQKGTHSSLLEEEGLYKTFWNAQGNTIFSR